MDANRLIKDVVMWGRNKKIDDPIMQCCKINEEVGELCSELTRARLNTKEVEDALGDILVTVIIEADILGYDAMECLSKAYEEIKERKGHTVNGSFVKD